MTNKKLYFKNFTIIHLKKLIFMKNLWNYFFTKYSDAKIIHLHVQ